MNKLKNLFSKPPEPKELVRKWQNTCRGEGRAIDRQIREIEREQKKVERSIRECAKRGDAASAKILAKEIVMARRTLTRLHTNKAQMNSVSMKLGETLGMVKAVGTLEKSTELMTMVNELVKVPEVAATMRNLSKEMMKAGMIEEMVADTLEDVLDEDGMEEETEAEVDKVLSEIAGETLANLPGTDAGRYKVAQADAARQAAAAQAEAEDVDMAALHDRLNSVRM